MNKVRFTLTKLDKKTKREIFQFWKSFYPANKRRPIN